MSSSHVARLRRGVVFSDSHFLAKFWSLPDDRFVPSDVNKLCRGKDIAVLNGDIFDVSHSGMVVAEWLDRAGDMLKNWLSSNQGCEFHYVIGNHDNYEPWIERLKLIAADFPGRLHVHVEGHGWRIGNALFTHGDFSRLKEGKRNLLPEAEMQEKSIRETKALERAFQPKNDRQKKTNALLRDLQKAGRLDGVEHVFAGHFHVIAQGYLPEGFKVQYHNSGSPTIEGTEFTPLTFDIDENNKVSNVQQTFPLILRLGFTL